MNVSKQIKKKKLKKKMISNICVSIYWILHSRGVLGARVFIYLQKRKILHFIRIVFRTKPRAFEQAKK